MKTEDLKMKKVAIIGAGAAGLPALRRVLDTPGLEPVIWEKSTGVGGTWAYTDKIHEDEHGLPVHSSMYKSLRTNLPKESMAYPDFQFSPGGDSFIHHTKVLSYLQDYANHHDLIKHIKFENQVERVAPTDPGSPNTLWEVTARDLKTGKSSTVTCHAIILANGHYSVPNMPQLPNMDKFIGMVEHSHRYRDPVPYAGKKVAVLGAAASGIDIALDMASVAEKVFLCHNFPIKIPSELPSNVQQVSGIVGVKDDSKGDTFLLKDGTQIQADALLFCTGYKFVYPFLTKECNVSIEKNQVKPLYRHLIHCQYPSMAFIGIPFHILPFPFFDVQVRYFLASMCGDITLPSTMEMLQHTEQSRKDQLEEGVAERHYHKMANKQWAYCDALVDEANIDKLDLAVRVLYDHVHDHRKYNLTTYKNKSYTLLEGSFEEIVKDDVVS